MEKVKGFFDDYKGLIIFYIIVAVLSCLLARKIDNINSEAQIVTEQRTYYA